MSLLKQALEAANTHCSPAFYSPGWQPAPGVLTGARCPSLPPSPVAWSARRRLHRHTAACLCTHTEAELPLWLRSVKAQRVAKGGLQGLRQQAVCTGVAAELRCSEGVPAAMVKSLLHRTGRSCKVTMAVPHHMPAKHSMTWPGLAVQLYSVSTSKLLRDPRGLQNCRRACCTAHLPTEQTQTLVHMLLTGTPLPPPATVHPGHVLGPQF